VILAYHRADGRRVPAEAEAVTVEDDGTATGWRSVSASAVGAFAGRLPENDVTDARNAVAAVAAMAPPAAVPLPGSPAETLDVAPHGPVAVAGIEDGPWWALADRARALLDVQTTLPRAAVGLVVHAPGRARMEHRGTETLELDLSGATVRTTIWRGYYESSDDRTVPVPGGGRVTAGPGWSFELPPDDVAIAAGAGTTWHVTVTFAIVRPDGAAVPVELQHTPRPAGS
jgi:hypothetical protein